MREYFEINEQDGNIFKIAPKISDFLVDTFLYSVFPKVSCSYIEKSVKECANARVLNQPFDYFELVQNHQTMREMIANELHAFLNGLALNMRVSEIDGKLVMLSDNPQYIQPLLQYGMISRIEEVALLEECKVIFNKGILQLKIGHPVQLINALLDYTFHESFQPSPRTIAFLESKEQWDESWFLYNWSLELQETIDRILKKSLQEISNNTELNEFDISSLKSVDFNEWRGKIFEFSVNDMKYIFRMNPQGFEALFDISGAISELLSVRQGEKS